MNFQEGDPVMHWTYGLGHITRLEERELAGATTLYYAVELSPDLIVWVPADDNLASRLRPPTPESEFRKLIQTLAGPAETLPDDRHERKTRLSNMLRDGRSDSLCRVIRDLYTYRLVRPLNDHDNVILKQARKALLGEWVLVLSVTHAQAEDELQRLLRSGPAGE